MINWLFTMAWRDSRRNRGKLLLFASSIVLGIAALVAIDAFSENLQKSIDNEAKTLIGADLALQTRQEGVTDKAILSLMDSLGGERAKEINFVSMALFPSRDSQTRLVAVRAIEGNFPFYGKINVEPASAAESFKKGTPKALIDNSLANQFNLKVAEKVQIGNISFDIAGFVSSAPGQSGIGSTVAPLVYLDMKDLEATGLVQRGSRVTFQYYFKFPTSVNPDFLIKPYEKRLKNAKVDFETVESRKKNIGNAFKNMTDFLGLVGFVALLLGCIGVASAVHIYVKDKRPTVAILRTLGASGMQAFWIVLIQITVMAILAAVLGAALGSLIQIYLPILLKDFLPIENVINELSWASISRGVLIGTIVAILFALLSLLSIRNTSPLRVLRASFEENANTRDFMLWLVCTFIVVVIGSFAYVQTKDVKAAAGFLAVLCIMFLILAGIAKMLTIAVRRFFPKGWSYVWRQGISNLYRPNNQTLILMVSIGLGTALVTTLFFTQNLLLKQVQLSGAGEQPNMLIFDIQTVNKEGVKSLVKGNQMPVIQDVPVVTMRLENFNGKNVNEILADSTNGLEDWALEREYRCTYRDTMIETETTLEGEFLNKSKKNDGVTYISVSERVAEALKIKVGDQLDFNVQSLLIPTVVSDIRKVNFNRVQTNFFVVFPNGVLEEAPQFHVVVTRTKDAQQSADFQKNIVQKFPNISVIDLSQILKTVDSVLGKVSFVIRFMALFSILTGLIVLISSVALSKYQRLQESVLLRTLGASRRQILSINAIEYLMLGVLATATGIILSSGAAFLLSKFVFKIPFDLDWIPTIIVFLSIVSLTLIIGLFNTRTVVNHPPLEVLRNEL
jgi:putative ABC transport system permease protein